MLGIGYARGDGRVGVSTLPKGPGIDGAFVNPHPGSLSLADPPHKGEGLRSRTRICEIASSVSRIPFPHLPQADASVPHERW
jgi:hypothetical protein